MPSGLTEQDQMAYYGEPPWHGKGVSVGHLMTASEAIRAAILDWTVRLEPQEWHGEPQEGHFWIVRTDLPSILGACGPDYVPIQNTDAFKFFDAVIKDYEDVAFYETVGSLMGGKYVWMLAKVPGDFYVIPGDYVRNYILMRLAHTGDDSLLIKHTSVRVVCWNTLSYALTQKLETPTVAIKHTASWPQRLALAHTMFGLATRNAEVLQQAFQQMARTELTGNTIQEFLQELFPSETEKKEGKPSPVMSKIRERVTDLFEAPINNLEPEYRHTAWSLYNAVTHWVDHERKTRGETERLYSAWFDLGAALKSRAFAWLMRKAA